ncbi:MAG: T9SS type A sorting domain-containing protein [Bacteroidales bacterium]|nr:T9SS type A sorting domain-containing protein [Bacteroidales bacterium]
MKKYCIFILAIFHLFIKWNAANAEEIIVNQTFTKDTAQQLNTMMNKNPAGDYVVAYFNTIELGKKGRIIINDLQGRRMGSLPLQSKQNQQVIDLSAYPNGIYLINLFVDEKLIVTKKLSKGLN